MKILVTGGAGFIGSAVVRHAIADGGHTVVNLDKLTYAANLQSLEPVAQDSRYSFERADICDEAHLRKILAEHRPDAVMHLAAETHVDRSIEVPEPFAMTNVIGTVRLLNAVRHYYGELSAAQQDAFRFLHVSTDEVFGALSPDSPPFDEATPYDPRSPYSASKAASDHFVRAWGETYHLPVLVTNCSNNYGPFQFPEKLIPLSILRAMGGEAIRVYGTGSNVRDWLYVEDHARALLAVLERGRPGETYCIGSETERTNLEAVNAICDLVDEIAHPLENGAPRRSLIQFVTDRPGHDFRYAMNPAKLKAELGWAPRQSFTEGLRKTVAWYAQNGAWWEPLRARYGGERLGLRGAA